MREKQDKMTSLARVAAGYAFSSTKLAPRTTASFSTSFLQKNKAADAFREKAKDVDRAVSNKIVDGISMGRKLDFLTIFELMRGEFSINMMQNL